jgi:hypothetical protein
MGEVQRREEHPPPWLRSGRVLQIRVFSPRALSRREVCEDALLVTYSYT